jgi:hypothetical protein
VRTFYSAAELRRGIEIASNATLCWEEVAEALQREGYPARTAKVLGARLLLAGAARRANDNGELLRPDRPVRVVVSSDPQTRRAPPVAPDPQGTVQTAEQLLALRADLVACRAEAAAATAAIAQAQRRAEIAQAKIDALLAEKERLLRKLVASVE